MKIFYSRKFLRAFTKLPKDIQEIYIAKEKILKDNPFHPILGVHKIKEINCYSFVVTYKIRVIFRFIDGGIEMLNIGDHSIYRK